MPRMQATARNQPRRILFDVLGYELIHTGGEPNHFRRYVVDQHGAIHAGIVEMLEKGTWRAAELGDLLEVSSLVLHQFQRMRLEHLHGLDVNVAVSDQSLVLGGWSLRRPAARVW